MPPPKHGLAVDRHIPTRSQIEAAMHLGARWIDSNRTGTCLMQCVKQSRWMADEIEQRMSLEVPCLLCFKVSVTRAGDM